MPPASEAVRGEWLRRIEAEYRSAAVTQHLGLWLIQIGAPPDLVEDALRIVSDEMAHAELSHVVYRDAGGTGAPRLPRETLELPRSRDALELDVLRHGVQIFCLGETVAVHLFKRLRSGCTAPAARRALDRILRDEVRHRDFGWTVLEWLLSTDRGGEYRALLERELSHMLARVRANYGGDLPVAPSSTPADECGASERAWGLMPLSEYAAALEETFTREYEPRFAAFRVPFLR